MICEEQKNKKNGKRRKWQYLLVGLDGTPELILGRDGY
jgi:hypothetical protein